MKSECARSHPSPINNQSGLGHPSGGFFFSSERLTAAFQFPWILRTSGFGPRRSGGFGLRLLGIKTLPLRFGERMERGTSGACLRLTESP